MIPFYILIAALPLLRALGACGVKRLASWRGAAAGAFAIMFCFTGITHFTEMKADYQAMIPSPLPSGMWVIYLTGALELLGAVDTETKRSTSPEGEATAELAVNDRLEETPQPAGVEHLAHKLRTARLGVAESTDELAYCLARQVHEQPLGEEDRRSPLDWLERLEPVEVGHRGGNEMIALGL